MTDKGNRTYLDRIAQDELSHLLRQHLERIPQRDGTTMCRYKGDWTDEKICVELRKVFPNANRSHVANYRLQVHGALIPAGGMRMSLPLTTQVLHQLCMKLGEYDLAKRLIVDTTTPAPRDPFDDLFDGLLSETETDK